jgi:hypothetical protein
MDSGPVKPARRWPLLPTRRAGEPATAPVSPTDHVNPAVPGNPPGEADSHGRKRDRRSHPDAPADESDGSSPSPGHQVDRSV